MSLCAWAPNPCNEVFQKFTAVMWFRIGCNADLKPDPGCKKLLVSTKNSYKLDMEMFNFFKGFTEFVLMK